MDDNFIINLGRQLGSGGHEIGEKIAAKLNITFYDKELINVASEKSGVCTEFFEKADEEASQTFSHSLSSFHIPFINESTIPNLNLLNNDGLFKIQSDVIRMISATESCLFIGRCANYILRDFPRCINIFISADMKDRISRIKQKRDITEEEAMELIDKCDKKRSDYYNYYTAGTWGAASTYHLCINSSLFGIDGTVDFLIDYIHQRLKLFDNK
jgi:shikimate kinase